MSVSGTLQQLLALADEQNQKTINFDNINGQQHVCEITEKESQQTIEKQQQTFCQLSEENKEEKTEFVQNSEINEWKETENTTTEERSAFIQKTNGGSIEDKNEEENGEQQQIENKIVKSSISCPIAVDVNQLNDLASKIRKDAIFPGFAEFYKAFKLWQRLFLRKFRVASSERHEKGSELEGHFKYKYVVYHCNAYGEPRKRGAGRRPHQHYLPCGCNAKLRLNFHAQNGGYLLITTLVTEHNHPPVTIEEFDSDSDGENKRRNKRKKSSPEDAGSSEHSPNSSESFKTPVVISSFSPLSLQHPLHNSPSSGGQSSSEGAELIQHQQKQQKRPSASPRERKSLTNRNKTNNGQQQKSNGGGDVCSDSSLVKNDGGLNAAFALNLALKVHHDSVAQQCQQQQTLFTTESPNNHPTAFQTFSTTNRHIPPLSDFIRFRPPLQFNNSNQNNSLLPLIQELINRSNGISENNNKQSTENSIQSEQQHQLLLGLLSQQQQQTPTSTPLRQQQIGNSSASLLATLQHSVMQQNRQQIPQLSSFGNQLTSSTSSNNNSANSMVTLLQIQNLLQNSSPNIFGLKTSQQQSTPNLINLLSGNNNNKIMTASTSNSMKNDTTEAMANRRADIIQEADQLLQTIVAQMIRTRDLANYLRRLRQFLADNFAE